MKLKTKIFSEILFFGILLSFLGFIYWLLYTSSGLNWTLKQINQLTGNILDYKTVKGAWLTPMELEYLAIKVPSVDIKGKNLRIEISVEDLLSGTLDVLNLQATDLSVVVSPISPSEQDTEDTQTSEFLLPIGIVVHSLHLDKFLYQQEDDPLVSLENVNASDTKIKRRIDIGSLYAKSPYGEITVEGNITPDVRSQMELHANFLLKPDEQFPQMQGSADFNGDLNGLSIHAEFTQPSKLLVNAKLESLIDEAKWQAEINTAEFSLQPFLPELPLILKNVKLNGAGGFSEYSVDAIATLSHEQFGDWNSVLALDKSATQWNIKTLNLANPLTTTSISATGALLTEYSFTADTEVDIQAAWQNLQWPLQDTPFVTSNNGTLAASGSVNNYQLQTTGVAVWSEYQVSNIDIVATGDMEKLNFSKINADGLDGHLQGSGALTFKEAIAWNADTKLDGINLHSLHPELTSKLRGNVKIDGAYKQDKVVSNIALNGFKGAIGERPIEGEARLSIDGTSIKVNKLELFSGKNRVRGIFDYIHGDASQPAYVKANWDVYVHDLELVAADLAGTVNSQGSLSGTMDKLSANATLQASDLKFLEYGVKSVNLDADIDLSEQTQSRITLLVQQGTMQDIPIERLQLNVKGTGLKHAIETKITQEPGNHVSMNGIGSWKDNIWTLSLNDTEVQSKQFGLWRQTVPSRIDISAAALSLSEYCLAHENQGNVCGSVKAKDFQKWDGMVTIEQIPFAMFKELLPAQFDSTDVDLSGQGKFAFSPETGALLDFIANGKNGVIKGVKVEDKETPIAFNQFDFALSNTNKKLAAKTSVTIEDTGRIYLELSFPNWSVLSVPELTESIEGHALIDLSNLTVLSFISDHIKDPVGEWHSDIAIGGTLQSPVLIGESRIQASSLTLTTLGLKLRDVDLKALSDEKRSINITGGAKSGQGRISINGTFNDYREAEPTGSIKIIGDNFELARIPEATIVASPNLNLTIKKNAVDLNGDITLTEAEFKIFAPTKTIAPSPDVVIVTAQEPELAQTPLAITSKIRIILGKKVKVQGYGFSGRLEGSVLVDDTGALTTASGKINILEGKYVAYGTELDISSGSLAFAGSSIENPLINVRAERRPTKDIVAGVLIDGEVQSPKITLFSDPSMQDSDILSYIILGQPLNSASDQDGKLLTNAAASLGLLGGEKLAKEIGEKFGIDEIKIQTDHTTQDTSLLLGKYLSPDFYVGYAIGIGNAVDTLQIQYKLTEQWVLKTQSGEQQKAEILFTIEKD